MIEKKTNISAMTVLILGLSTIALPLYLTIVIAFKQPTEMTNSISGILSLPKTWSLNNFREAMEITDFWNSLKNSLLITGLTVVLSIVVHSLMGYALGRNKAKSKFYSFVYLFIVSGMFVPFAILMMPLAKQTSCKLVWRNLTLCGILYADECAFVLGISCEYSHGIGGSGQGRRSFHMDNILEDSLPDYAPHARDGGRTDSAGSME